MESAVEIVRLTSDEERAEAGSRSRRRKLMRDFGRWLKERDIPQSFAAGLLGVHRGYLSNLIAGKHVANAEICKKALQVMTTGDSASPRARSEKIDLTDGEQIALELRDIATGKTPPPPDEAVPPSVVVDVTVGPSKPVQVSKPQPLRRPLDEDACKAVSSIVLVMIGQRPEMTPGELVAVTRAVADGFR